MGEGHCVKWNVGISERSGRWSNSRGCHVSYLCDHFFDWCHDYVWNVLKFSSILFSNVELLSSTLFWSSV